MIQGFTRVEIGIALVATSAILAVAFAVYQYQDEIRSKLSKSDSDGPSWDFDFSGAQKTGSKGVDFLTSYRFKGFVITVVVFAGLIGLWYAAFLRDGVIAALLYAFLFIFFFGVIPSTIGVLGNVTPGNASLAKLHIILGAIAFNHHYFVQRDEGWEWCPGSADEVYIDGEWREIKGGKENRSVFGWRPFGVLLDKQDVDLGEYRADTRANNERQKDLRRQDPTMQDGGTIERGGWEEVQNINITGDDGWWLIDLKRVYSSGIKKIGDIELIETAEEIIERGQVDTSRLKGWRPIIGSLVGLFFGVITGYIFFVGGG